MSDRRQKCPHSNVSVIQQSATNKFVTFKALQSIIYSNQKLWNDVDQTGAFFDNFPRNGKYSVVIAGQGKAGKSTFINDLFRGSVELPWQDSQCTRRFTKIILSPDHENHISFRDVDNLESHIQTLECHDNKIQLPEDYIKDYEKFGGKKGFVELKLLSPILCEGMEVIDSPGIGQNKDTSSDFGIILPNMKTDLLLYIFDARDSFGNKDFFYFSELNTILSNNIDDIIIIANKLDRDFDAERRNSSDSSDSDDEMEQKSEKNFPFTLSKSDVLKGLQDKEVSEELFMLSSGGVFEHLKDLSPLKWNRPFLEAFLRLEDRISQIIEARLCDMVLRHAKLLQPTISQIITIQEKKDLRSCVDQITRERNIKSLKDANLSKTLKTLHRDILHHFKDLLQEKWSIDNFKDEVNDIMNLNQVTFEQVTLVSLKNTELCPEFLPSNMKRLTNVTTFLIDRCFYIVRNTLRLIHEDKILDKKMRQFKQLLSQFLPGTSVQKSLFFTEEKLGSLQLDEGPMSKRDDQPSSSNTIALRNDIRNLVSQALQKIHQLYLKKYINQISKAETFNINDYMQIMKENQSFVVNKVETFAKENAKEFEDKLDEGIKEQLSVFEKENVSSGGGVETEEIQEELPFTTHEYLKTWMDIVSLILPAEFTNHLQTLSAQMSSDDNYYVLPLERLNEKWRITTFHINQKGLTEQEAIFNIIRSIFNLENFPSVRSCVRFQKFDRVYINCDRSNIYSITPSRGIRLVDCAKDLDFDEKEFLIREIYSALRFVHLNMRIMYNFRPDNIYYDKKERKIYLDFALPCHALIPFINSSGKSIEPFFLHPAVQQTYPGLTAGHEIYTFGWTIWLLLMEEIEEAPKIQSANPLNWLQKLRDSQPYIKNLSSDYLKRMMVFCWGIETGSQIDHIYKQLTKICGEEYHLKAANLLYEKGYYSGK